ncbi:hypothetical protein JCGZ_18345 [Jatropha curcas]|uniref:UspA domain-containing protein n=1 Tax=Jatropha curcas TaxID=180498 RepID=A0A067KC59_JATCU|nr:uncharacterized protein LOC105642042 isoform X2 [Jatropha curcas]KDP29424.1 hypothetical protein JCGZ_18345 [Jatropha curcas]
MEKEKGSNNKKVMVAIDESESTYYALMWVLDNLKEWVTNSPLVIFSAQPSPKIWYAYAGLIGSTSMYSLVSPTMELSSIAQERNKKVSLGLLEKAKKICASRGVKVETITEAGDPKELICNVVKTYNISLLVLGYNEGGALKRAFMGSQSSYCLTNANCPVLVVKKPQKKDSKSKSSHPR